MSETVSEIRDVFWKLQNVGLEELESCGQQLAEYQRGIYWWLGDVARYAEARYPDTWNQIFPPWMSQGLIQRCIAVAKAYPNESDRNPLASWTTHMREANAPDRIARVNAHVEAGRTSDEARKTKRSSAPEHRYMLAIDVNYYLHRFWHSGAGVEAAMGVANWIDRTVTRLQKDFPGRPLTDVCCCFDAKTNHRKALTTEWEDGYKPRPPKDPELAHQLNMVRDLLDGKGYCCASIDDMEGDDIMASLAEQFDGVVTLLTQDKDVRQCLSGHCNMLLDIEWLEDEHTGEVVPKYQWLSRLDHFEQTGIPPTHWTEYQCLMGDNVDGIRGAEGIGKKFAADLIQWFETAEGAIAAAKAEDDRITPRKREALIAFEAKLDVTRQLVTLRTDLPIPRNTRI